MAEGEISLLDIGYFLSSPALPSLPNVYKLRITVCRIQGDKKNAKSIYLAVRDRPDIDTAVFELRSDRTVTVLFSVTRVVSCGGNELDDLIAEVKRKALEHSISPDAISNL